MTEAVEGKWLAGVLEGASQADGAPRAGTASCGLPSGSRATPLWTLKATQLLGAAAWACLLRYIVVFYVGIGLGRRQIGVLMLISPVASFAGQLFWSTIIDRLGDFKRPLVGTTAAGTCLVFLCLLPQVQRSFTLLAVVTALYNFMLSTAGPIIDAMCLKVLAERPDTQEGYGNQRLWCAVGWGGMSLVLGHLVDMFGTRFLFFGFGAIQAANIAIVVIWLPPPERPSSGAAAAHSGPRRFLTFDVVCFFANLIVYGVSMALVENFLFVFLLQDFEGTPNVLLGATVAMMCAFEVPVFALMERLWKRRSGEAAISRVLLGSQLIFALRCWLYTLLPRDRPWLVLLIEPLHGITFAAMWCAAVEYGRLVAPRGMEARMQALVNGLFVQVAMGLGSVLWGHLVERAPTGLGFDACLYLDAGLTVAWLPLWLAGRSLGRRLLGLGRTVAFPEGARALSQADVGLAR